MQRLVAEPTKFIRHYVSGTPRNMLLGAGLYYAVEHEKYEHIPIVVICPSVYAGYHLYKHRDDAAEWLRRLRRWTWI
jgi:hypothetical protein